MNCIRSQNLDVPVFFWHDVLELNSRLLNPQLTSMYLLVASELSAISFASHKRGYLKNFPSAPTPCKNVTGSKPFFMFKQVRNKQFHHEIHSILSEEVEVVYGQSSTLPRTVRGNS